MEGHRHWRPSPPARPGQRGFGPMACVPGGGSPRVYWRVPTKRALRRLREGKGGWLESHPPIVRAGCWLSGLHVRASHSCKEGLVVPSDDASLARRIRAAGGDDELACLGHAKREI